MATRSKSSPIHTRIRQRMRWSVLRRTERPAPATASPQPRFWSLLLPPRYPGDRR